MHQVYHIIQIW